MSKTGKKKHCVLCNGAHDHTIHNSCELLMYTKVNRTRMSGKYHPKMENVMSIMSDPVSLKIDSLNIQLLRLMAVCFVYDNSDNTTTTFLCEIKKRSHNFDKLLQYNPIPLTLPKNQLKKELHKKWSKIHALKRKHEAGPPQIESEHSCPICMEDLAEYEWFHYEYRFVTRVEQIQMTKIDGEYVYKYTSGVNPVKTSCGHIICSNCSGKLMRNHVARVDGIHFRTLSDYKYYNICHDSVMERLLQFYNIKCPMCRRNCIIEKRLGIDNDKVWGKRTKNWWMLTRPKTFVMKNDRFEWCDSPWHDETRINNIYGLRVDVS